QTATEIPDITQMRPEIVVQYWREQRGIVRDTSSNTLFITQDQGQTWQSADNLTAPNAKWLSVPGTDKLITIADNQFCEDAEGDFDFTCHELPIAIDPIEIEVVGDDDYWVLTEDALIQISK
ncbi:MAG: hypothetical protein AAGM67_09845, partial [Bacteroidota bacterium]